MSLKCYVHRDTVNEPKTIFMDGGHVEVWMPRQIYCYHENDDILNYGPNLRFQNVHSFNTLREAYDYMLTQIQTADLKRYAGKVMSAIAATQREVDHKPQL